MGRMAEKSLAALADGQDATLAETLAVQESFVRVHLLFWIPLMLERLSASEFRLFYPQMIKVLHSFLELDLELTQDMIKSLT